jgi:hypothetical protein
VEVNCFVKQRPFQGMLLALALMVSACGGSGGGDSASNSSTSGSVGSGSTACATGNRSGLVAVGLYGDVGTGAVSSGGAQISITAGGTTTSRSLKADTVTGVCADTSSAITMRTAFTSQGQVGMSFATISSLDQPVFLLDGSKLVTSLANLAGSYNLLRFQKELAKNGGSTSTRSSYATMVIDGSGNWYFCKNVSTCTLGTATGSGTLNLQSGNTDRFDLVANSITRGTVFVSDNAGSRVLVVGENDAGDPNSTVHGLWIGAIRVAWAANDGSYMLNTTDFGINTFSMSSNVIAANSTITATVDAPLQGFLTAQSSGNDNYIIQTAAGLIVTANNTGNNFGAGPGYFSFGVKP